MMIPSMRSLVFLAILAGLSNAAHSQHTMPLPASEKLMAQYLRQIKVSTHDDERELYNRFVSDALVSSLSNPASFDYPFDSLKAITIVKSPDDAFRLYTWSMGTHAGYQRFYGLIQFPATSETPGSVVRLSDYTDSLPDPTFERLPPTRWFGAVYYTIIPEILKTGETIYTLLGWHGIDQKVSCRIIDVLTFPSPGSPAFGLPVFCTEDQKRPQRILFRYSAQASMVLTYDQQTIREGKKWNISKRRFDEMTARAFLIVCDRLVPPDPQLEGQWEYYIPVADVMDGYVFEDGCWTFVKDIDARNPAARPKKLPKAPDQ